MRKIYFMLKRIKGVIVTTVIMISYKKADRVLQVIRWTDEWPNEYYEWTDRYYEWTDEYHDQTDEWTDEYNRRLLRVDKRVLRVTRQVIP